MKGRGRDGKGPSTAVRKGQQAVLIRDVIHYSAGNLLRTKAIQGIFRVSSGCTRVPVPPHRCAAPEGNTAPTPLLLLLLLPRPRPLQETCYSRWEMHVAPTCYLFIFVVYLYLFAFPYLFTCFIFTLVFF